MANRQDSARSSGSDVSSSGPDFLVIGQIIKAHGVNGEVSVQVMTDFPERFDSLSEIYLGDEHDRNTALHQVEATRWHKDRVLIKFKDTPTRTEAQYLRKLYLKIPRSEAATLPEGEFYQHQLLGLQVFTDEDDYLGDLVQVLETGANDVYIIKGDRGEILLPAIDEVILDIQLAEGKILVHLLEGLV